MQLRYAVLAIAAVLICSNLSAVACPTEIVSPPPAQLTSEAYFSADIEDDETVPSQIREQAALAHTVPKLMAFSTDVEDESVTAYVLELAHSAARRDMIAAMEAIDSVPEASDLSSFLTDVEDESVSSYFRELADTGSSPNSALQDGDGRAGRESGPGASAFWSDDNEFAGAEEQVTGSTSTGPLTEASRSTATRIGKGYEW